MPAMPTSTSGAHSTVSTISTVRAVPRVSGCGKSSVSATPRPSSSRTELSVAISARTSSFDSLPRATFARFAPQCGQAVACSFTLPPQLSHSVTAIPAS